MATVRFKDFRVQTKARTKNQAEKVIRSLAFQTERNAKSSMTGGGRPHQPSLPGEPPRVDTGRLRSSITSEFDFSGIELFARVGTNVIYGRFLELGTRFILPRPFLRPALRKAVIRRT